MTIGLKISGKHMWQKRFLLNNQEVIYWFLARNTNHFNLKKGDLHVEKS